MIESLTATVFFVCIFLFGSHLKIRRIKYRRLFLSFAAGVTVAYVFMHFLPELKTTGAIFVEETAHKMLLFPEYRVYFAAMIGFLFFYGLELVVRQARLKNIQSSQIVFNGHIIGFALYGWLISYLMIRGLDTRPLPILIYATAMGLHFLTIDYSLHYEYGKTYEKPGKYIISASVLSGWIIGYFIELPKPIIITLLSFISGGIIINSMIIELSEEKQGKFIPFLTGSLFYSALLILI